MTETGLAGFDFVDVCPVDRDAPGLADLAGDSATVARNVANRRNRPAPLRVNHRVHNYTERSSSQTLKNYFRFFLSKMTVQALGSKSRLSFLKGNGL